MHDQPLSSRLAFAQRSAKLEQLLNSGRQLIARVPLKSWQFLVILLLVLWLTHSLARLFWLVLPEPQMPPAAVALTPHTNTSIDLTSQIVDLDKLKALDVFGQAHTTAANTLEPTTISPAIEAETVDTQLNLVLVGVIASNEESAGRAIIAANGAQAIYAPGEDLPINKNVTLVKVLNLRVILNNNGRLESLWLYQDADKSATRGRVANAIAPEQAISRSWSDDGELAVEVEPPSAVYVDGGVNRQRAGGPMTSDPVAEVSRNIADVVAMSIHREGGQVVGYKIRPGRNAEQFTALGLEANDIVTAVNGMPLDNPSKIMEIYKNMANATSATLEIKRGGSIMSVDIVLQ